MLSPRHLLQPSEGPRTALPAGPHAYMCCLALGGRTDETRPPPRKRSGSATKQPPCGISYD